LFEENDRNRNWLPQVKDWLAQQEKWLVDEFGRYEQKRSQVLNELARLSQDGKENPAYKKWNELLLSKDFGC
jgi:hypothetical protein